eukprot:5982136-Pleurochrysis_carterae.AAC.1
MTGTSCFLLGSFLVVIAYMDIMYFFFEGEAAVAMLPYLALAIAAIIYSSLKDPFMAPKSRPTAGVRVPPRGFIKAAIMVVVTFWIPGAVAVCSTCYGQLPNCVGGAKCPLAVLPV